MGRWEGANGMFGRPERSFLYENGIFNIHSGCVGEIGLSGDRAENDEVTWDGTDFMGKTVP
ncbi:MAG: hypothetical protein AB1478_12710 [Nitrospirota bacterium]